MLTLTLAVGDDCVLIGDPENPICRISIAKLGTERVALSFDTRNCYRPRLSGNPDWPDRVEIYRGVVAAKIINERVAARKASS